MSSYQYRDPNVKDKTVSRQSYLWHGNPHTWERRSLHLDGFWCLTWRCAKLERWVPQHILFSTPSMVTTRTGPTWSSGKPRVRTWEGSMELAAPLLLTHWGRVMHICVSKLTLIGSDNAWSVPTHYLNQWWNIANWTRRNKLQWNLNPNAYIFIHENAFENVVCKMAGIWS